MGEKSGCIESLDSGEKEKGNSSNASKMDGALLDDLSGFDFEELMTDVFRHLGFDNVKNTSKTGDVGRDIIMEEVDESGEKRSVIVECKHQSSVGRPVVQKLHSAVSTYPAEGEARGIVVTTGKFSGPAKGYAEGIEKIELIDGTDLIDIGEDIGLDLYNGKIEILCEEALPAPPRENIYAPVKEEFSTIDSFAEEYVGYRDFDLYFLPTLLVKANIDAVFETSLGVVNRIDKVDRVVVLATREETKIEGEKVKELVLENAPRSVNLAKKDFEDEYPDLEILRFGKTETEYKGPVINRIRERNTEIAKYTGKNNVDYEKECKPKKSDVTILDMTPIYVPWVRSSTKIKEYKYPYEYLSAHPKFARYEDGIHKCVHCGDSNASNYVFCKNCGSINCPDHIETERLEQTPICTGCAVVDKFFYKEKYFYNEDNLEEFRREYEDMPFYSKAMENKPLTGALVAIVIFIIAMASYLTIY